MTEKPTQNPKGQFPASQQKSQKKQLSLLKPTEVIQVENTSIPEVPSQIPVWEIEKVLDRKKINNETHYRIKWKDSEILSWEPIEHLVEAMGEIAKFEKELKRKREVRSKQKQKQQKDFERNIGLRELTSDKESYRSQVESHRGKEKDSAFQYLPSERSNQTLPQSQQVQERPQPRKKEKLQSKKKSKVKDKQFSQPKQEEQTHPRLTRSIISKPVNEPIDLISGNESGQYEKQVSPIFSEMKMYSESNFATTGGQSYPLTEPLQSAQNALEFQPISAQPETKVSKKKEIKNKRTNEIQKNAEKSSSAEKKEKMSRIAAEVKELLNCNWQKPKKSNENEDVSIKPEISKEKTSRRIKENSSTEEPEQILPQKEILGKLRSDKSSNIKEKNSAEKGKSKEPKKKVTPEKDIKQSASVKVDKDEISLLSHEANRTPTKGKEKKSKKVENTSATISKSAESLTEKLSDQLEKEIKKEATGAEKMPFVKVQNEISFNAISIKRIQSLFDSDDKSREYLVEYEDGFLMKLKTDQMILKHPKEFAYYLEEKCEKIMWKK